MEFLSAEYNSSSHPVNLVLQSPDSVRNGFNAASTGTFDINQLPFNPSDGFHEYRFDWSPTAVIFYADGVAIKTMTKAIPTSPGHITLSHWSNGDPAWSAGPPETDAIVTVEYLKGYFNSSDTKRQSDWAHRCSNVAAPNATCAVPELRAAPNGNQSADTYFFTQQKNMTNNQTGSGLTSLASSMKGNALWYLQGATTVSVLFMAVRLFDWCL
jgi:beta-glucanase (GH16 family)